MSIEDLLIANRGEIAVRIARAAALLGIRTHAIHSDDDVSSDHVRKADCAHRLPGLGAAAYLDTGRIVKLALATGCRAIHPGYGFLSERADFAHACETAGVRFVGPSSSSLELFGDKCRARELAARCDVPILRGSAGPVTLGEAAGFLHALGPGGVMMIKAVAGGGGRGIRPVGDVADVPAAYERCRSEALQAFGRGDVYVEECFPVARHVEIQVVGDGTGEVVHLWERECTLQRKRQKLVEVAPAPDLSPSLRDRLCAASLAMARAARLASLATFEFLVDGTRDDDARFVFIESNPRLQVEHTVTEAVTGLDLVRLQLEIAGGRTLRELGLVAGRIPEPRGMAIQLRVNAEVQQADGTIRPSSGTLSAFDPPSGPGVRVDTCGYGGYEVNPRFDSLLAKVVVHAVEGGLVELARRCRRALSEFRISGVASNREFLLNVLAHPDFVVGRWDTGWIEARLPSLCLSGGHRAYFVDEPEARVPANDRDADPLAVLALGKRALVPGAGDRETLPEGARGIAAPVSGTVVSIDVDVGGRVRRGQQIAVVEAMKMEHVVTAPCAGIVREIRAGGRDTVAEGASLVVIEPTEDAVETIAPLRDADPERPRADLAELERRRRLTLDAARPEVVKRRHDAGMRTARENILDLCDPDSFHEYGAFAVAAQRSRRSMQDLVERTPADGLVMGIGRVNGDCFPDSDARCVAMAYDYTVLAGTQGSRNHEKKDRMFELAEHWRLPVVMFAEGGGGRPGDTDVHTSGMLHIKAFSLLARLSGLVPLVGVVAGRCFAGNAVVAGCCDVIIATAGSSIGMGGPAMIEGGGLGVFHPDEVGPVAVQRRNGVIDIVVADEAEAVSVAKRYLSYFQGELASWSCADQRELRHAIPENRLRVYDVRKAIELLADRDSVLELRRDFAGNMITALIRIEGRPLGLIANNPMVLGGAIDAPAADKAARFLQLCDAFDLPVLSLCDTPGNMVGPDAERTALVRHCCRLYVVGANMTVPVFSVVMRKAYGLGAQGMVGGSFHVPMFSVAWPTAELGPMNLEGAVKLGFRKELEAIADPAARKARFDEMVAEAYERGKALYAATLFEIDDVIDPAATRGWVMAGLRSLPPRAPRLGKKVPRVDTW